MDNNNLQAGLANINAKADIKSEVKVADKLHTQIGGTTNNVDNSCKQVITQNFNIAIIQNVDVNESVVKALSSGNENAQLVEQEIQKLLSDNCIPESKVKEKLSNPEVLSTIAEANKIAYKTNDVNKRKILSNLIFKKLTEENDDDSNTLSLAIRNMENLTNNHLKIIAFLHLFNSGYVRENVKVSELIEFNEKYIKPLIDIPYKKLQDIGMYVIASGCAVSYTFAGEIYRLLPRGLWINDFSYNFHPHINPSLRSLVMNLDSIWNKLDTSSSNLTPLGKCLGKMYLAEVLGLYVEDKTNTKSPIKNAEKILLYEEISDNN